MAEKRALVLSTGGRNGAWGAGVLYGLRTEMGLEFDVVSGSSTGALMTGPALLDDLETLNEIYRGGVRKKDILDSRNLFWAYLRKGRTGLNGTKKLRKTIEKHTDIQALAEAWAKGKRAIVTYVNMRTGRVVRHSNRPGSLDGWVDAVLASASIPFAMDPHLINGDFCGDGGQIDLIPLMPVLRVPGVTEVVVIRNGPLEVPVLDRNPDGLIEIGTRALDIILTEMARNDLAAQACLAQGKKVTVYAPDHDLGPPLDFNEKAMTQLWQDGFKSVVSGKGVVHTP